MPAERGGTETRLTIVTRADESQMSSVFISITVVTSMSTFKVKWLLSYMNLEITPPTCGNTDSLSRTPSSPRETVVGDKVEFPFKSISMAKGLSRRQQRREIRTTAKRGNRHGGPF
jgi:hypothetical protein